MRLFINSRNEMKGSKEKQEDQHALHSRKREDEEEKERGKGDVFLKKSTAELTSIPETIYPKTGCWDGVEVSKKSKKELGKNTRHQRKESQMSDGEGC